jgi:hypothetical protein
MSDIESTLGLSGELSAVIIRADGTREDKGIISGTRPVFQRQIAALHHQKPGFWRKIYNSLRRDGKIPMAIGFGAFVSHVFMHGRFDPMCFAVVSTAGVNYVATDFQAGQASPHVGAFTNHDAGTGGAHGSTTSITSGPTNATPIVCTATAHGYTLNDLAVVSGTTGNTAANANWQLSPLTANTFTLLGSVGNGAPGGSPIVQLINGAADTAMTTTAIGSGLAARVSGSQSNPSANIYQSQSTLSFTATLSISEWGIFSASSSGTLLDRRWFNNAGAPNVAASAAITVLTMGVNSGDSIQFTYKLTLNAGGS